MNSLKQDQLPPGPDDEGAYIFIDHREEESSIVSYVSQFLASDDALEALENEDGLVVKHKNKNYKVPIQYSMHDRYIALSSLAELLSENYRFYLLVPSLDGDTHGVLVAHKTVTNMWGEVPAHLQPLELGYDYFGHIRVPYLNHEESAPDFSEDRARGESIRAATGDFVNALFSGKITDESAQRFAKIVLAEERQSGKLSGRTEEEIAAEIKVEMNEALSATEVRSARSEMEKAMSDLRSLIKPKKWWEFWK